MHLSTCLLGVSSREEQFIAKEFIEKICYPIVDPGGSGMLKIDHLKC